MFIILKKVLVTGCAGFIGSNIVEKENIKGLDFEFVQGSINDRDSLMAILKDVDHILHQAAIPSVPRSIDDPMRSNIAK